VARPLSPLRPTPQCPFSCTASLAMCPTAGNLGGCCKVHDGVSLARALHGNAVLPAKASGVIEAAKIFNGEGVTPGSDGEMLIRRSVSSSGLEAVGTRSTSTTPTSSCVRSTRMTRGASWRTL